MPPGKNPKLTDAQVAILRTWIDPVRAEDTKAAGKRLGRHGELLVVSAPDSATVPAVRRRRMFATRSTVSCSSGSPLKGLEFSPEASRLTLVRRFYFDLWGLPPSPEQADAFLADDRPDAWERLIDSLLASPTIWRALGAGTGSTSRGMPTRRVSLTPTTNARPPGAIAIS